MPAQPTPSDPARFHLDRAEQAIGSDAPLGALIAAVMALAEEQRTANLIALSAYMDTAEAQDALTDAAAARLGVETHR